MLNSFTQNRKFLHVDSIHSCMRSIQIQIWPEQYLASLLPYSQNYAVYSRTGQGNLSSVKWHCILMAYHQTAIHEQQKCAQSLNNPFPKFYKVACLWKWNYWASQFIQPQALYLSVSETGVWLSVGQYTGYNGTKTLGTGPIKWSVPINESDVGAVM